MTADVVALGLTAVVSILVPILVLVIVVKKNPMERLRILVAFIVGAVIYLIVRMGLVEQGLQFLFNHTSLQDFMSEHYIPYLLIVAVVNAVLVMTAFLLVVKFVFKAQLSFSRAAMLAFGYSTAEAVALAGYRSICTIIEYYSNEEVEISSSTAELFLNSYERILLMVIHVAIIVALVYFVEGKMIFRGFFIGIFALTMVNFLPGFFIAFTTTNYFEVFERSVALIFVYLVLTVAAVCGVFVLNGLKYSLKDEKVDSKQAVKEFEKKQAEKRAKKEKKN
jgi:hypothetical protein